LTAVLDRLEKIECIDSDKKKHALSESVKAEFSAKLVVGPVKEKNKANYTVETEEHKEEIEEITTLVQIITKCLQMVNVFINWVILAMTFMVYLMILIFGIVAIIYVFQITFAPDDILVDFHKIRTQMWECMKPQNQRRNLGNKLCKSNWVKLPPNIFEPTNVQNHVLICASGDDLFHQKACEILKANNVATGHFDDVLTVHVSKNTEFVNLKNEIFTFLDIFDKNKIRVTIVIFCHGSSDEICAKPFASFYEYVLKPVREVSKQILILDESCYSGNHMKIYLDITEGEEQIEVEIYIPASCNDSPSFRNYEKNAPFINSLMFDLLLRRIAIPSLNLYNRERFFDGVMFMNETQNTKTFMNLPKIFQEFHKGGFVFKCSACYSYHPPNIRTAGYKINEFDISLESWFDHRGSDDDYQLISVFRDRCDQIPSRVGNDDKKCHMYRIHYSHMKPFLENPKIELTYFLLKEKTFQKMEPILKVKEGYPCGTVYRQSPEKVELVFTEVSPVTNYDLYIDQYYGFIEIQMKFK